MIILNPANANPVVWDSDVTGVPIKVWGDRDAFKAQGEDCSDQMVNLAEHPTAFHHIAMMPDFHLGYGMPIGGVMACLNAVIPNAVGNDIGCGMMAVQTDIKAYNFTRAELQAMRLAIHKRVPVGEARNTRERDLPIVGSYDLDVEANENFYASTLVTTARLQMGTLGGGNHFIELQKDEDDYLWLMIHSGSRGVGAKMCQYYSRLAQDENEKWHTSAPKDLAFFPEGTDNFNRYIGDMRWAMAFAEGNRATILNEVVIAIDEAMASERGGPFYMHAHLQQRIETHHNYAAQDHHFGKNPWVHRKGAVKAHGLVIIPGSMGTASYIGEGLNNPESFGSCSHGGGRVMGRKVANKTFTMEDAKAQMGDVVFGIKNGDYAEMPGAYKNIDDVIAAQADLVTPVHRLTPLAVVKG